MTLSDFGDAVEVMVEAFNPRDAAQRIKTLHMFFGEQPYQLIEEAAKEAVRTLDRWPVPAIFTDVVHKTRPKMPKGLGATSQSECGRCRGDGCVSYFGKEGIIFSAACACPNGTMMAKNRMVWGPNLGPLYHEEARRLIDENPTKLIAGVELLRNLKVTIPSFVVEKVDKIKAEIEALPF